DQIELLRSCRDNPRDQHKEGYTRVAAPVYPFTITRTFDGKNDDTIRHLLPFLSMINHPYRDQESHTVMSTYKGIYRLIESVRAQLADQPQLASTFAQCFPNALETTIDVREDGSTFVLTGDIPAMWLRDASAQVAP